MRRIRTLLQAGFELLPIQNWVLIPTFRPPHCVSHHRSPFDICGNVQHVGAAQSDASLHQVSSEYNIIELLRVADTF